MWLIYKIESYLRLVHKASKTMVFPITVMRNMFARVAISNFAKFSSLSRGMSTPMSCKSNSFPSEEFPFMISTLQLFDIDQLNHFRKI